MNSWIEISEDSDFSIYNIPFGIFSVGDSGKRMGIAIGDQVLDIAELNSLGLLGHDIQQDIFENNYLNDFIALGKPVTSSVREKIQKELCDESSVLKENSDVFYDQSEVTMHLPIQVGDYTDFYSSIEHATNLGKLFRDPENALLPNWRHLPVGYHGRASSIILSGQPIHRPKGQTKPPEGDPVFGPCRLLDFELEMAFIIGKSSQLGDRISTGDAGDHIFGMVLFNDWSARDIQKWEYVPLGPFLGKSFASSISPWVVTMDALSYYKVAGPVQEPKVLPYLQYEGDKNYDINLQVSIAPEGGEETVISNSNYKYMYWNQEQQLAHHTVNGCNVNVGDMMASGTISGKDEHSYGSLLEITQAGKKSLTLIGGEERKFIQDNDTLTLRGHCKKDGRRVGFGEVSAKILPAKD
ncbi:MAG: fumarylacetoacetase [Saprospiraceae bacterium]|nr:fumarylacetoacetase [Saprospiraceae bacterium]